MIELFIRILYFICIIFILNYIGKFAFNYLPNKKNKEFNSLFFKLLLGWIISIVGISIFKSNGLTISIYWAILLILICINKIDLRPNFGNDVYSKKSILLFGSFSVLIFLLNYFRFHDISTFTFITPFKDFRYYSYISTQLFSSGIENTYIYNDILPVLGSTPYHYSELWFNSIIGNLFNIVNIKSLMLFTYPIGSVIVFFGFFELLSKYKLGSLYVRMFLSFCGLVITGLKFNELFDWIPWVQNLEIFGFDAFFFPKLFPVYIFILAFFIVYDRQSSDAYVFLLFIPGAYILTTPFVLSIVSFVIITEYSKYKKINLVLLYSFVFFIIVLFILYIFNKTCIGQYSGFEIQKLFSFKQFKFIVSVVLSITLKIFLFYIPIWVLFYNLRKQFFKNKNLILSILFGFYISAIIYGVLFETVDSIQIVSNFLIPFCNIFSIYLIAKFIETFETFQRFILGILFIVIVVRLSVAYSIQTDGLKCYKEVVYLLENKNKFGVSFSNLIDNDDIHEKKTYIDMPLPRLISENSNFKNANLSICDWKYHNKQDSSILRNSLFFQYIEKLKSESKFISIEQSKLFFIEENEIDYLVLNNYKLAQLPPNILNLVTDTLVCDNSTLVLIDRKLINKNVK